MLAEASENGDSTTWRPVGSEAEGLRVTPRWGELVA